MKSVRAGASLHGSYAKGVPPKLLAKCSFFHFRFGWEHGSSKNEVVSPFLLSSSPNHLVSRRLQRKMHKTCKNSKKYEKIATFSASYSHINRLLFVHFSLNIKIKIYI